MLKVNEVFTSIEGEGIRAGLPTTFIRLQGCNLRCTYCDTMYAHGQDGGFEVSVGNLVGEVKSNGISRVTLTGGEPLLQVEARALVQDLSDHGFEVNVETNGSQPIVPYIRMGDKVIVTMDFKSPYSGADLSMDVRNLHYLRAGHDVLKFVVASLYDLRRMRAVLEEYKPGCHVFVSPVFGRIDPKDIVQYVLANNLRNVRVQLQLHKCIWDPQQRGV